MFEESAYLCQNKQKLRLKAQNNAKIYQMHPAGQIVQKGKRRNIFVSEKVRYHEQSWAILLSMKSPRVNLLLCHIKDLKMVNNFTCYKYKGPLYRQQTSVTPEMRYF